jgi:chloramphenicol 3-O phosphotransferase
VALAQQVRVHAHGLYDVECDTTTASPYDCAARIAGFLGTGQAPTAFDRLRSLLLDRAKADPETAPARCDRLP